MPCSVQCSQCSHNSTSEYSRRKHNMIIIIIIISSISSSARISLGEIMTISDACLGTYDIDFSDRIRLRNIIYD